jgi:hypothetical protein
MSRSTAKHNYNFDALKPLCASQLYVFSSTMATANYVVKLTSFFHTLPS